MSNYGRSYNHWHIRHFEAHEKITPEDNHLDASDDELAGAHVVRPNNLFFLMYYHFAPAGSSKVALRQVEWLEAGRVVIPHLHLDDTNLWRPRDCAHSAVWRSFGDSDDGLCEIADLSPARGHSSRPGTSANWCGSSSSYSSS